MTKREEKMESCSCEKCRCGGGRVLGLSLSAVGVIIGIITCLIACGALFHAQKSYEYSKASYDLNVLSAGGEESFNRMNEIYQSEAYIEYAAEKTEEMEDYFGLSEEVSDGTTQYSSLNSLMSIAVNLGTDGSALQACIDEGRYTQAVNDMMTQASTLFGVSGTPGNVIIDRENGNFISIAGAYPVDEFVNAINEYKNGAENYVAGGDEVKTFVEDMLKSTPIRGDKDARFTIVEYTELLCPYCQRHSQEGTINAVMEQFPNEVNSVSRHFIIHGDEALQLAAAMECVAELNPDAYHKTFEEAFAKGL